MIYEKLYDWQKRIVDHLSTKKSFGLFLDMGTGKTVQALALAEKIGADKILVVTKNAKAMEPKGAPGSWYAWASQLDGFEIRSKKDGLVGLSADDKLIFVTNYESVFDRTGSKKGIWLKPQIEEFIRLCRNRSVTLILDESHSIKDPSTSQAKALQQVKRSLQLKAAVLHTYLLTGTPFTTGFIDVYNQLKYLDCPITKTEFRDRFCELGHIRGLLGWQQPIVGYKNLPELYDLIHEYAITIKSEEVLQLPPQIFETDFTRPSEYFDILIRKTLSEDKIGALNCARIARGLPSLSDDFKPFHISKNICVNPWYRNIGYPNMDCVADTAGTLWMRARQLSIGFQGNQTSHIWYDRSRLEKIKEFLTNNPDNYVLFYNYVPEFIELFYICESLGYRIDVYNGAIKSMIFYNKFASQTDAERAVNRKNIILSNFASGSTGMNWQLFSKCIIASIPVYKDWAQGLKRIHRDGSKETATYYIFAGDNWLDRDMLDSLQKKEDYSEEMFKKKLDEIQSV